MKRIGRVLCAALAAALCLTLTLAALAEGGALSTLYRAGCALLFDTDNATLHMDAEFSYNGILFKTLAGSYVQDGSDSRMEVMLKTPRSDGTVYEGGYTVIGNDGTAYAMETIRPRVYTCSGCGRSASILSTTVLRRMLLRLGAAVLDVSEGAFAAGVAQENLAEGGTRYRIAVRPGDTPELVNAAGTVIAQALAGRFFGAANPDFYDIVPATAADAMIVYDDYDALFANQYRALYQEEQPADFYERIFSTDEEGRAAYQRYEAVKGKIDELAGDAAAACKGGVVNVTAEGELVLYESEDAYRVATGRQTVAYADHEAAFRRFYEEQTGEALSEETLRALQRTTNEALISAYQEMNTAMEARYLEQVRADGKAPMIYVKADGSARMIYDSAAFLETLNTGTTVTSMIVNSFSALSLDTADVTATLDGQGRLTQASGSVRLIVADLYGRDNELEITFTAEAGAYGESTVETFDPAHYGVMDVAEYLDYTQGGSIADIAPTPEEKPLPERVTFNGVEYQVNGNNG